MIPETILFNGSEARVPTKPGMYLHRIKNHPDWPFTLQRVWRRWWLFGPLIMFSDGIFGHATPVSHWAAECWRVPKEIKLSR